MVGAAACSGTECCSVSKKEGKKKRKIVDHSIVVFFSHFPKGVLFPGPSNVNTFLKCSCPKLSSPS
jgi:hypothetical protein